MVHNGLLAFVIDRLTVDRRHIAAGLSVPHDGPRGDRIAGGVADGLEGVAERAGRAGNLRYGFWGLSADDFLVGLDIGDFRLSRKIAGKIGCKVSDRVSKRF